MGRRINSFGYRLGITHFWKFQRGVSISYNLYSILTRHSLNQMVSSLFSFYGYKVLLYSDNLKLKNIILSVYVLKSSLFDLNAKKIFNTMDNTSINYKLYFFESLFQIKRLFKKLNLIMIYFFKIIIYINNFFGLFNLPYFFSYLSLLFIFFNGILKMLFFDYFKLFIKNLKLKKSKKLFFSNYNLKLISKKVEKKLSILVPKKLVKLKSASIYNLFPYKYKKKFNLGFRSFWTIKRNFKFFEIIYFSCFFSLSNIIVDIMISNLSRKKKTHYKFLSFFFYFIEFLYFKELLPIVGIKLLLFGKLNAKMRKQSISLLLGKLWLSNLLGQISFNQQDHETRFGVLGVRVWVSKGLLIK